MVIDDEPTYNSKTKRFSNDFVHREAIHTYKKGREEIFPNPDRSDPTPMFLKPPRRMNQRLFRTHNKQLDMPEHLKQRYKKNNKK